MSPRVLMLGWEYPPHISGGLGIACEGLTRALAEEGLKVTFVVPQIYGDEQADHMRLVDPQSLPQKPSATVTDSRQVAFAGATVQQQLTRPATGVASRTHVERAEELESNLLTLVRTEEMRTLLRPYDTPLQYSERIESMIEETIRRQHESEAQFHSGPVAHPGGQHQSRNENAAANTAQAASTRKAHYSGDLFAEVERYAALARRLARHVEFDLIHAHDWMTWPAALAIARDSGKPLIVHVHSTEFDRSGKHVNHDIFRIERAGIQGADRVIAVSYYTRGLVASTHSVPLERISVVHNGVTRQQGLRDYHISRVDNAQKRVLFLGRITYQKGPEYFVQAARMVVKHVDTVRFVMAGSGDLLEPMKRLVEAEGLMSWFEFPGFLRGADLERELTLADLYVMPSVSEPFGIAPLEAVAYDTPVMVSRQSGVSEVLSHCLKFDFWDVRAIAERILAVLKHQVLGRNMREMAQQELLNIHWRAAAQKTAKVYNEIAGA